MTIPDHLLDFIKRAYLRRKSYHPLRLIKKTLDNPWLFSSRYTLEGSTLVTVYTNRPEFFPGYQPIEVLEGASKKTRMTATLVITSRNERDSARKLLVSIQNQTRLPDEIIAVDTGSDDGTLELLQELADESPVPMRVLNVAGANIARGRNEAIAHSCGEVIVVTDFGCTHSPDWLENLVTPFEINPDIQVAAGHYEPVNQQGEKAVWPIRLSLDQIDPQTYLPPSVSVAFTKQAWVSAGGYPEWLSLTGEDSYFDLELKLRTSHWAFVPDAVAYWEVPSTFWGSVKKAFAWSIGSGEVGMNTEGHRNLAVKIGFVVGTLFGILMLTIIAGLMSSITFVALAFGLSVLWLGVLFKQFMKKGRSLKRLCLEYGMNIAQLLGYLKGVSQRPEVDRRRQSSLAGVWFVLAGVPIDDTGGGARSAQIALELLRRHFLVIYINRFPKYEGADIELNLRHPNLVTCSLGGVPAKKYLTKFQHILAKRPSGAILELPSKEFLPLLGLLRQKGIPIIYDLIDDWDSELGKGWYSADTEKTVIDSVNALVATAPILVRRLDNFTDRPVSLLPNAVDLRLFNPDRFYSRPKDLPISDFIIMYTGALWGDWFDWQLLAKIATNFDSADVVVIGDYHDQVPERLPNLHFLGLKAQKSLPAYLAHAHVTIIPWKVNDITRATSPLKLFEYLAMRKPVVTPNLPLLAGIPYVFCSKDNKEFLRNVQRAARLEVGGEEIELFLRKNSWQSRVDDLVGIVQKSYTGETNRPQ